MSDTFVPGSLVVFNVRRLARSIYMGSLQPCVNEFNQGTFGIVVSIANITTHPMNTDPVKYAFIIASDGMIGWLKIDEKSVELDYALRGSVTHV